MFDIVCKDACQRRKFENFYDVRMTENVWSFWKTKEARDKCIVKTMLTLNGPKQ